ncbi:MAG: hypothetical protein ABL921_35455 [Pirellula sp.]
MSSVPDSPAIAKSSVANGTVSKTVIAAPFFRSYATMTAGIGRRLMPLAVVIAAVFLLRNLRDYWAIRLGNEAFVSGYALLLVVIALMLLGVRKRVTTGQLGRVAIWQRTHHYLGVASVGAYAMHADLITSGWLESALAFAFWAIATSGFVSWYVNRTAPKMLRAAGQQVLRQDIATRKKEVAEQAYQLAMAAAGKSETAALADHYRSQLQRFLMERRRLLYRVSPNGTQRRRILGELENLDRYLSEAGRQQRKTMSVLVHTKDDLDFQSAIQNRVRLWASIHAWLLGSFVVLTIAHVVFAHQFSSHW